MCAYMDQVLMKFYFRFQETHVTSFILFANLRCKM